jgi:hypothetical protein
LFSTPLVRSSSRRNKIQIAPHSLRENANTNRSSRTCA